MLGHVLPLRMENKMHFAVFFCHFSTSANSEVARCVTDVTSLVMQQLLNQFWGKKKKKGPIKTYYSGSNHGARPDTGLPLGTMNLEPDSDVLPLYLKKIWHSAISNLHFSAVLSEKRRG